MSQHTLRLTPRRRDPRRGLSDVLATVVRTLHARMDPAATRSAFEEAVCRLLLAKSVALRDARPRWPHSRASERAGDCAAVELPQAGASPPAVLEATSDSGTPFSDWDLQLLDDAAQVGVLVLEIERGRGAPGGRAAAVPARSKRDGAAPLIGSTSVMASLRSRIERVASTDFTVLLEGESGVGKELVAHQIHDLSRRRNGPFVAINCAALVETLLEAELFGIEDRTATGVRGRRGKFEHADGGTLFLDEVSDLSLSAQAKLLRAIQDLAVERVGGNGSQRVDIRIVAATNRSLSEMVQRKLFRADLYYRLGGVDIRVPPLRERRSDVAELTAYFLERHRHTRTLRVSEAARQALMLYDWPGNVRELERTIERAIALVEGDVIELDDLPPAVRGDHALVLTPSLERGDTLRVWGSRYARLVLDRSRGNKREASRRLGISYHTLNAYLRLVPPAAGGDDDGREQSAVEGEEGEVEEVPASI
ncbi:MAG: sigma-54 interaction domain-containing protein [Vicinamibacterales bacterium]